LKKAPLAVWLGVAAVSAVLIAAIAFGAVSVLRPGGMQMTMPTEDKIEVAFVDGSVLINTSVDVTNNGAYDLENAVIHIVVTGPQGLLMERTIHAGGLKAGRTTPVALGASLDLNSLSNALKNELIFNGTTLEITATVETDYMLGMVSGNFTLHRTVVFSPLISNLSVDTINVRLNTTTLSYIIEVPYSFDAAPSVLGSLVISNATLNNSTGVIGQGSSEFEVSSHTQGFFPIVLSDAGISFLLSHSDELRLDLSLSVGEVALTQQYSEPWQPLVGGLHIDASNMTLVRNGSQSHLLLPYQLDTSPRVAGKTFLVSASVSNASGLIGVASLAMTVLPHMNGIVDVIVDESVADWFSDHVEQLDVTIRVSMGAAFFEQHMILSWDPSTGTVLG